MAMEEPLDSIKQYGTEDTPLNYSREDELSNLSFNSSTGELINLGEIGDDESPIHDDDKSDISSIADDGEDCEDLLSEAIAAAMPKKVAKSSKPDSQGCKGQSNRMVGGASAQEKQQMARQSYPPKGSYSMAARAVTQTVPQQGDTCKTYAEEGTPINFSRATSLSDLSHLDPDGASQDHSIDSEIDESDQFDELPTAYFDGDTSFPVEIMDSPMSFGQEGTPLCFSRNDSLSSLSCDEDAELESAKQSLRSARVPTHSKGSPKALLTPKQRLFGRLTSPGSKNRSPGSRAQRTLAFGKPQPQSPLAMSPPRSEFDQLQTFEVEGTPNCFSRNSSLSSLNSTENDPEVGEANISDIRGNEEEDYRQACSTDSSAEQEQLDAQLPPDSFYVEDTPANFSRNSSLSSLSVESLGFEPSEAALLEECINAAMPKTKSAKKKISKIPRNCPTSSSTPKDKFVKPRTLPGGEIPKVKTPSPSCEGSPKNAQSSQHGNEAERIKVENMREHPQLAIENVVWRHRSPSQELEGSPKLLKDASNQEKVLGALMMESEDWKSEGKDDSQVKNLVFDFDNKLYISESEFENKNNDEDLDNKLAEMELADSDMIASAIFREASEIAEEFAEAAQMESGSCSESDDPIVAKEDIEATKENPIVQEDGDQLGCVPLDFSFHDITKETFPDMGFSLGSSMMSSLGEENPQVTVRNKLSTGASVTSDAEQSFDEGVGSTNTTVEDSKRYSDVTEGSDTNSHDITLEEEKALEENAELLIRELSSVHLSQLSSSANSEMFIENETISLVSNDTDTASEVSVSLSCSSKAMSEKTNEDSNAPSSAAPRPRILKPGERSSLEVKAKEEETKAVRGKRKPLISRVNSGKPANTETPTKNDPKAKKVTPPTKPGPVKSKPPVGNTKVTPKTPNKVTPPMKPTPSKTNVKQTKPTGPPTGKPTAGIKPTPKASAVVAPMASTKNASQNVKSTPRKPSPARSGTASPRNQSPADKMRNKGPKEPSSLASSNVKKPQSKVTANLSKVKTRENGKVNNNDTDRPKPPIKQGTFTKDSPTQNAPEIEGEEGSSGSNRSSAELKYSNDTQEKAPADKISPRSSKTDNAGPSSTPPAVTNLKQNGTPKSVAGKSNSTGNLTKTTKSVTKTASGSNLTKTGSNTSLTKNTGNFKVPNKPPLKKADSTSNQSLKRENTPAKKPGASTPTKKGNEKSGGRATVPVASKIASLWRKDTKAASPSKPNADKKTPSKKEKEKTPVKSTDMKPKFLRRSLASSQPSKGAKEDGKPSKGMNKKDEKGMQRSSTYDKLPVNEDEAEETAGKSEPTGGSPAKNNVWRRTYTIETEDEVLQAVTSEDIDSSCSSPGVWMRRDGDRTPGKSQIPAPVRTSPDQGDNRGNKPSPPSAFPSKALGLSPPGAKGPSVTSPNAAIVAPFNYVPSQNKPVSSTNDQDDDLKGSKPNSTETTPVKPMTKTEMLIARRRQSYLNSVNKTSDDPKSNEEEDGKRTACLVTTV